MRTKRGNGIAVVCIVLAVVVAGALCALLVMDRRAKQQEALRAERLNAAIRPYRKELMEIRDELADKKEEIPYKPLIAEAALGYQVSGTEQLAYIRKQLEQRPNCRPAIVLDCNQPSAAVVQLLSAATELTEDFILTGSPFSETTLATMQEVVGALPDYGIESVSILLRREDDWEENRELLQTLDCVEGYLFYSEEGANGMTEDAKPYVCYGFYSDPGAQIATLVSLLLPNNTAGFFCLDLEELAGGMVDEACVKAWESEFWGYVSYGYMEYGSLEQVFDGVRFADEATAENQRAYEEYEKEQLVREEELDRKIREIYEAG